MDKAMQPEREKRKREKGIYSTKKRNRIKKDNGKQKQQLQGKEESFKT